MSDNRGAQESGLDPVYVIESIPVAASTRSPPEEIARRAIPTPAHLRLYPELGRGGMGRIHPATDRNLLRHVALKRLDKELASGALLPRRVHRRSADDRAARAPEHRARCTSSPSSDDGRALLHDEARAGRRRFDAVAARSARPRRHDRAARGGARDLPQGLRRRRVRAPPRRHPPRPQAREHHGRRRSARST